MIQSRFISHLGLSTLFAGLSAVLVGGVPIATAVALFGVIWTIIRLPKPSAMDEA